MESVTKYGEYEPLKCVHNTQLHRDMRWDTPYGK